MNLIEERKENKRKLWLEVIIMVITLLGGFTIIMVSAFFEMPVGWRVALICIAVLIMVGGIAVMCVLEFSAGGFECQKCKAKGIPYGFGGIARIGEGTLPAESIVMEHYRLGSSRVILSRSFCNTDEITDIASVETIFSENMTLLRAYETSLADKTDLDYSDNIKAVKRNVNMIVKKIKEKKVQ